MYFLSPRFGLQLYTLRDDCARGLDATLAFVARCGYAGVEVASLHAMQFGDKAARAFDTAHALGAKLVVAPFAQPNRFASASEVAALASELNAANEAARMHGLRLAYHNHFWEWCALEDGLVCRGDEGSGEEERGVARPRAATAGRCSMILDRLDPTAAEFARATGWELKPEGACRAEVCVPLPGSARRADGRVEVRAVADALGMGLVASEAYGLWALGPVSGGRALTTAVAPDITLNDRWGKPFSLASLKGTKVFLATWASW